jgi:tetratricopeptide (TPR) repeat protein
MRPFGRHRLCPALHLVRQPRHPHWHPLHHVGQVQMLVLLAEYTEAELWARKALELFRNNPDLLAGRSQALTRLARLNDALAISDASISQEGNSAYRWMARGDLMLARKDAVEAHCFEKAVLADNSSVVMLEIARIYHYHRKHAKALVWARKGRRKSARHGVRVVCSGT